MPNPSHEITKSPAVDVIESEPEFHRLSLQHRLAALRREAVLSRRRFEALVAATGTMLASERAEAYAHVNRLARIEHHLGDEALMVNDVPPVDLEGVRAELEGHIQAELAKPSPYVVNQDRVGFASSQLANQNLGQQRGY